MALEMKKDARAGMCTQAMGRDATENQAILFGWSPTSRALTVPLWHWQQAGSSESSFPLATCTWLECENYAFTGSAPSLLPRTTSHLVSVLCNGVSRSWRDPRDTVLPLGGNPGNQGIHNSMH